MYNILITGASSGIGHATTKFFLNKGNRVFGSVRSEKDAKKLSEEFNDNFVPVIFDVTDNKSIIKAKEKISSIIGNDGLDCLVNNAGINVNGPMMYVSIEDLKRQFDVNVHGIVRVTQAFLPLLGFGNRNKKKQTKIFNISSVSGKISQPFLGPYSSSKYAVEAISDSWRRELLDFNIDLVIIEPGPIESEIWSKARESKPDFSNTEYATFYKKIDKFIKDNENNALPAKKVGELIFKLFLKKKTKTRYIITKNKFFTKIMIYLLPDRFIDNVIKKKFKTLINE